MNNDYFLKQLNEVIKEVEGLVEREYNNDSVEADEYAFVYSKSKSTLARISGVNSHFYKDLIKGISEGSYVDRLRRVAGICKALRSDIENGYLKSLHQVIQADVFSDYLEMAEYLLDEGYKDPSAVIAGSTLEAHLRDLAKSASIELTVNGKPKKASQINDELAKAGVYSSAYQKQVTAWLGIRNFAAHGDYVKYSLQEVNLMIQGIRQFTLK